MGFAKLCQNKEVAWRFVQIHINAVQRKGKANKCFCVGVIVYKCECLTKMQKYICKLGCFSKDTLKKNKKTNPVRNWGGPRENISRRRG